MSMAFVLLLAIYAVLVALGWKMQGTLAEMMEGAGIPVGWEPDPPRLPLGYTWPRLDSVFTTDIFFICGGAFDGLDRGDAASGEIEAADLIEYGPIPRLAHLLSIRAVLDAPKQGAS